MQHEIEIDLHVSQVGKTLEAEAGTGTEPDLGEVDSSPTRLLNQLHLMVMVVLKWPNENKIMPTCLVGLSTKN